MRIAAHVKNGYPAEVFVSEISQIKSNAAWVIDNFGPRSGVEPFAYTAASVEYIDGFIERQGAMVRASDESINKFVGLLGAYLGEMIIATYGGEWQEAPNGISLVVNRNDQMHFLQPFHKVHKRIVNGAEDSLSTYFNELLPQVFGTA